MHIMELFGSGPLYMMSGGCGSKERLTTITPGGLFKVVELGEGDDGGNNAL